MMGVVGLGRFFAQDDGEAVAFGKEGGIVHLSLKEEGGRPLPLVFGEIGAAADAEGVALVGGQGGDTPNDK